MTEEAEIPWRRPPGFETEPRPIFQEPGHESTWVYLGLARFFPDGTIYRDNEGLEAFLLAKAVSYGKLSTAERDHLANIALERTNYHLE